MLRTPTIRSTFKSPSQMFESLKRPSSRAQRYWIVRTFAPEVGTILDIDLRPGERIGQQTLLRMGKSDTMMVRSEVYESDVAKIYVGQAAIVYASAFDQPLSGVVGQVATLVQRQTIVDSNPAANTDARVVEVLVRLREVDSPVAAKFVGMQVHVEFSL